MGRRNSRDDEEAGPLKILAVEDSPSARKVLQGVLLRLGVALQDLRLASDSVEAMRVFSQWQPDLVFLDVELHPSAARPGPDGGAAPKGDAPPPVDGDELARRLLERAPKLHLVVVTAYDRDHPRVKALLKSGAADVIVKPVLAARVEEILNRFSRDGGRARVR
ncbi:MAG TPA: response regulator [Thermoplasmata archaeon]|nr:response regulator [Thermoplasmata archaeon]